MLHHFTLVMSYSAQCFLGRISSWRGETKITSIRLPRLRDNTSQTYSAFFLFQGTMFCNLNFIPIIPHSRNTNHQFHIPNQVQFFAFQSGFANNFVANSCFFLKKCLRFVPLTSLFTFVVSLCFFFLFRFSVGLLGRPGPRLLHHGQAPRHQDRA